VLDTINTTDDLRRFPDLTDEVLDIINTTDDLRRFPLSYHSIKRYFFNLDVIPRRTPEFKTVVNASYRLSVMSS
jgi:hypothetical protein